MTYIKHCVSESGVPFDLTIDGQPGDPVLENLGYQPQGGSEMATTAKKAKSPKAKTSREERKELAALVQKYLKEQRPDLTKAEMKKVASALYHSLGDQIKSQA